MHIAGGPNRMSVLMNPLAMMLIAFETSVCVTNTEATSVIHFIAVNQNRLEAIKSEALRMLSLVTPTNGAAIRPHMTNIARTAGNKYNALVATASATFIMRAYCSGTGNRISNSVCHVADRFFLV